MKLKLLLFFVVFSSFSWAQKTISGNVIDENGIAQSVVFILNVNKNQSVFSDAKGNYSILADHGDELRFVKDGFYRTEIKVHENVLAENKNVVIRHVEILIPEVKLEFQPTGNLEKDAKNAGDSKRVVALNSSMEKYMKSPMAEALPKNEVQKTFRGHDFQEGHASLDVVKTLVFISNLIANRSKPKITKANYYETQTFIKEIKSKINLDFLRDYGMRDDSIDAFLLYANDTFQLAKKYRKDFNTVKITSELRAAFAEYSKLNNVSQ